MAASRSPLPGRKYSFKNLQVIVVLCFLFLEETEEATLLLLFSESRERNENGDVLATVFWLMYRVKHGKELTL